MPPKGTPTPPGSNWCTVCRKRVAGWAREVWVANAYFLVKHCPDCGGEVSRTGGVYSIAFTESEADQAAREHRDRGC